MTEYRLITKHTIIADTYLQFKSKKKRWWGKDKEVWRYVPSESPACVLGYALSEKDCPTSLHFLNDSYLISSFEGQEGFANGPIAFSNNYPEISVYFDFINNKRKQHLEKIRNRKDNGTVTLIGEK